MHATAELALIAPDSFPGVWFTALILTAAMIIPAGFLFAVLREKMAAKISAKERSSFHPAHPPSPVVGASLLLFAAAIISPTSTRRARPVNPCIALRSESHTTAATSVFSHN